MSSRPALIDDHPTFSGVPDLFGSLGLRQYWERHTFRSFVPGPTDAGDAMLLDTLGLGLEQSSRYLSQRPEYGSFVQWVLATVGSPPPERVARFVADRAGLPPPPGTALRLAEIDAARPSSIRRT